MAHLPADLAARALTRRPFLGLALTAVGAMGLAACSSPDPAATDSSAPLPASTDLVDPTEPVQITWFDAENDNIKVGDTIAKFEAEHPNITVNYVTAPFADYDTVLATRLQTGDVDLIGVDQTNAPTYYANGWLSDLSTVFADDVNLLDAASVAASTLDGKLLNAPRQSDTTVLFYNKDILDAAGIAYPSSDPGQPASTWEWVRESGKAAQDTGAATWGITWERIALRYYQWPLVEQLGGGTGVAADDTTYPELDSEAAITALQWYGDLYTDGISPKGDTTSVYTSLFAEGSSAFHTGGSWDIETLNANADLNYGIAKFPVFEAGSEASNSGGFALGLNPTSTKKDAALLLIKALVFDDKGGELRYNAEASSPPANQAGKEIFWELDRFQDERAKPLRDIVQHQLDNGIAKPVLLSYASVEINSILATAIADIANGADVATRLASAQEEAVKQTEKYR